MVTLLLILALLVVCYAIVHLIGSAMSGCGFSMIAIAGGAVQGLFELLAETLNALSQ